MTSLYSRQREDHINPRPDLPTLLVVSNYHIAEALQRSLNPREVVVLPVGAPLIGSQFKTIIVASAMYENDLRFHPSEMRERAYTEWMHHLPTKLAPGCGDFLINAY